MIDLETADAEELAKFKVWLFKENMRLQAERQELAEQKKNFESEVRNVRLQMKNETRQLDYKRRQFANEENLIKEKWKLLKKGFDELDEDRKALRRLEKQLLEKRKALSAGVEPSLAASSVSMFFKGVHDSLSLKKRYKDLIKIFHPDNIAGDNETVLSINREYDSLKSKME